MGRQARVEGVGMRAIANGIIGFVIAAGLFLLLTPVTAQERVFMYGTNGATGIVQFMTSLANYPLSTLLTGRALQGANLSENGPRWAVSHSPAASAKATIAIAAEAGTRHVAQCIGWSAESAGGAVTAAAGTVILYDGAVVLIPTAIAHAAAAAAGVQNVPPNSICNLNLVGTTNTDMKVEFDALVTNELQRVWMTGYNVQ